MVDQRATAGLESVLRHEREMRALIDQINRPMREVQAIVDQATWPHRQVQALIDRANRPMREVQAIVDQATWPHRQVQALIDRINRPTREVQAVIDQATRPSRDMQAMIDRLLDLSPSDVVAAGAFADTYLAASAEAVRSIDAGSLLAEEAPALLSDPVKWLEEKEAASRDGDTQASQALLLVKHIYGCMLLFTRQLNPSFEAVEKYSRALSLMVLLVICSGMLATYSPSTLTGINNIFSTPTGLMGVYLAVRSLKPSRPRRNKPSKMHRRRSKPGRRTLRRYR